MWKVIGAVVAGLLVILAAYLQAPKGEQAPVEAAQPPPEVAREEPATVAPEGAEQSETYWDHYLNCEWKVADIPHFLSVVPREGNWR